MKKVTPLSEQQYYPMMLANGKDAVMVDYTGSMFSALTGHSHYEQHQNTPCGWYKVAQRSKIPDAIQAVVFSGYQVIVDGEVCEPEWYEQEFEPKKATLSTSLRFLGGFELKIQSFLTDSSILVEHYEALEVPENQDAAVTFIASKLRSGGSAVALHNQLQFITQEHPQGVKFNYNFGDKINGLGFMLTDREFDNYQDVSETSRSLRFENINTGWEATKFLVVEDSSESDEYIKNLELKVASCINDGWEKLKSRHEASWSEYFAKSEINVPDSELQYLFELGRYSTRAHLHPETGGLTVGMLPHLWSGGIYCPYDAFFMHQALLLGNNTKEAGKHLSYYERQYEAGKDVVRELNSVGTAFSGWTNCFGEHHSGRKFKDYVMHYKPVMTAFIALKIYWQWKYTRHISEKQKNMLADILKFVRANFVVENSEYAEIKPCMAGNESDIEVKNDTFTSLAFARAFAGYAEITADNEYKLLAEKLYNSVEGNYKDDILTPYQDAKYLATLQFDFHIFNLPQGTRPASTYGSIEDSATPWGLDTIQPSERYRDWPWLGSKAAICLTDIEDPKNAFKWLMHSKKHTSSLGAIPEKIRMDGFAIGYWYSTPFGILIWATCAAMCHIDKDNCLKLLYGLDGQWQELNIKDVRLPGALLVTMEVKGGKVTKFEIKNDNSNDINIKLALNPIYKGNIPESIEIAPATIEKII